LHFIPGSTFFEPLSASKLGESKFNGEAKVPNTRFATWELFVLIGGILIVLAILIIIIVCVIVRRKREVQSDASDEMQAEPDMPLPPSLASVFQDQPILLDMFFEAPDEADSLWIMSIGECSSSSHSFLKHQQE
jgi:heme/copper-type cytochrome/quinol oxidase subunit 1